MPVLFSSDDFVQGGLLSDVDVEITSAAFVAWDYNGALPVADVLAVKLTLKVLDSDTEAEQFFSVGKTGDFIPNPANDGATAEPVGNRTQFTKGCNWHLFIESMEDCGVPKAAIRETKGDVTKFVGAKIHVERKPAPKREGLKQDSREHKYEPQIMICTKVISMPWDKAGKATKAKSTAASGASAAAAPAANAPVAPASISDEASDIANTVLVDAISASESGAVTMSQLKVALLRATKTLTPAVRNQVNAAVQSAAWLTQNGFASNPDKSIAIA